jgi:hypothetical protein
LIYPRPTHLASIRNLNTTWDASKDGLNRGRAAGVDGLTPKQFRNRLDQGLARVRGRLLSPEFGFLPLRVTFIPKRSGGDSPNEPVDFLGFDIIREKNSYKIVAPSRAKERVAELLKPFCTYATCQAEWRTFAAALNALNAKVSSFTNSYRIATNYDDLKSHAANCKRQAIIRLVTDFFGVDVTTALSSEKLVFLDIDSEG